MRRLLIAVLMLAAFCVQAMGQITNPASIKFTLVNRDVESDNRLVALTPWYTMHGNIKGDAALSAYPDISADSMEILTNYHERYWTITIKSWETPDLELELREYGFGAARGKFKDTFTLTNLGGGQFWTDSLFKNVAGHTFDWSVCFGDTADIDVNDEFRFYFWKTRFIPGAGIDLPPDRFGALATFSLPGSDTLTIAAWDTITAAADTFYTTAVPGDMGYVSLFIDQYPLINTNISLFGVGLQVKMEDGEWSRPLGNTRDKVKTVVDSAACDSAVVSERINNIPADSVRYVFWGKGAADIIFRKIRALWRD